MTIVTHTSVYFDFFVRMYVRVIFCMLLKDKITVEFDEYTWKIFLRSQHCFTCYKTQPKIRPVSYRVWLKQLKSCVSFIKKRKTDSENILSVSQFSSRILCGQGTWITHHKKDFSADSLSTQSRPADEISHSIMSNG